MFKISSKKNSDTRVRKSFVLYIFFALFAPPILPSLNFILPLAIFSFIVLFFSYRKELKEIFLKTSALRFIIGLLIYYIYLFAIISFSFVMDTHVQQSHYVTMLYSLFLLMPVSVVCSIYIVARAHRLEYGINELIRCFVIAGLMQVMLVLLAFAVPDIKAYFVEVMYLNTGDNLLNTPWLINVRFYGFANNLLDLFGLGMGILATLSLFLSEKLGKKYVVFFFLLLVPAALNARSGMIIGALGALFFIFHLAMVRKTFKIIALTISVLVIVTIGVGVITRYAPDTMSWIMQDIASFTGSSEEGTATKLFSSNFLTMPSNLMQVVFGSGHTLYQAEGFPHSDIGYINDLWRTGIVGMILLYGAICGLFIKALKSNKDNNIKTLIIFMGISLIIFSIKGGVWVYSTGMIVILSLLLYIQLNNKGKEARA